MKNLLTSVVSEVKLSYVNRVPASQRQQVNRSSDVVDLLRLIWDENSIDHVESFYILLINRANKVLGYKLLSQGGLSGTVVDPKIIFQAALLANASSVILAHNHPSGNVKPSESDIRITKKVIDAGKLLELQCLDHVIITSDSFFSFSDEGMM